MRWASPVMYFRRNVTKDTELRGQEIKEGDKVSIWYISANRDEDVFDDPFDVRHHCATRTSTSASAAAARTTASARTSPAWRSTCCSRRWRKRMPTIERTGDAQPLRSNFIAGIKHMPVKYPPGRSEQRRSGSPHVSVPRDAACVRFRFGVELHGPVRGPDVDRHGARGRSARVLDDVRARPLRRRARADRGDGERGRGHDDAEGRRARVRLRLPASRGARARARDDRPDLRGPARSRARRGLEAARLRPLRHPDGTAQGARRPHDRAHARSSRRCSPKSRSRSHGEHYRITDLPGNAAAVHARAVRRSSSAAAQRRVLRFAGATADIVGVNASIHSGEIDTAAAHDALPERIDEKVGWVREGAGDALRRRSRSTRGSRSPKVTDDTAGVADVIGQLFSADPKDVLAIAAHADRLASPSAPTVCANGASAGATRTRSSPATRRATSRRWSPSSTRASSTKGRDEDLVRVSRRSRTPSSTSSKPSNSATSGRGCTTRPRCTATSG